MAKAKSQPKLDDFNVTSMKPASITGDYSYTTTPNYTFGPSISQPIYQTQPYIPIAPEPPKVPGLDELCEILEVREYTNPETTTAFTVMGMSGKVYNLVDLISAQVEIMARLHLLLVHRNITSEE